jgi:hypothetical protein
MLAAGVGRFSLVLLEFQRVGETSAISLIRAPLRNGFGVEVLTNGLFQDHCVAIAIWFRGYGRAKAPRKGMDFYCMLRRGDLWGARII